MPLARSTVSPPSSTAIEDAALDLSPSPVLLRVVTEQIEAGNPNLVAVGALVARCPIFTFHMLRAGNSPEWAEKTVRPTIAARRLGPSRILVICADLSSGGEGAPPQLELLERANRMARTSAYLAKLRFAFDRQHAAHVAGLLTVMGTLVAARLGADLEGRPVRVAETVAFDRAQIGMTHAQIAERLVRQWFFPHELAQAVGSFADPGPPEDPLARAVWLAARLVDSPSEALDAARACGFSADAAQMVCLQQAIGPTKTPLFKELRRPCPLTERQLDYIRHLAAGESRSAIAERFGRARATVDNVLSLAYKNLGVSGEYRALMLCKEQGWI